ncbi:MAG: lysine--tRNA ligase, partial [Alphaproteobacteria bacterium]|nr:lysine--tRNA ligase [Alphaproteobacteria bacterium]MCR9258058.1 lysine--tRNA ligase [Alphaproteobacteria bacterium]
VGKGLMPDDLRGWFKAVYEILLGQEQGPRMGSFVDLYGRDETVALIRDTLKQAA